MTKVIIILDYEVKTEYIYKMLDFTEEEILKFLNHNMMDKVNCDLYFGEVNIPEEKLKDITNQITVYDFYNHGKEMKEVNHNIFAGASELFMEKLLKLFAKEVYKTDTGLQYYEDLCKNYKKYISEAIIKNIVE